MNKSDFISDAVALDLGKSGVKVAETLEMNVGGEWWRLINSAEPMTIKGFVKRIELGVDINEGEMDISPISTVFETAGEGTYSDQGGNTHSMIVRVKQGEGESDLIRLYVMHKNKNRISNYEKIKAFMYQMDGTLEKSYTEYSIGALYYVKNSVAFWDYVNQRAILVFLATNISSYNKIFYADASGTGVIASSYLGYLPVQSTEVKTFLEAPEKIYSLFRGTGITVRVTIPTVGLVASTLANTVCNPTGATPVTVASNYRNKEAFLFYSRTHESAGVAWIDKTNNRLYYALESDAWSIAYEMSSAFSDDNFDYFGNMTLKGNMGGEYYVAGRSNYRTGNFSKPVGFSFPANLSLMGVADSLSGYVRIFGRIGTVLYSYFVDQNTMAILAENSIDTGNTISENFQPVKISESETRELYFLNYCVHNLTKGVIKALLVNIDKATNNILWVWGYGDTGWLDTTAWTVLSSASGRWYQTIRKYKGDLAFISFGSIIGTWQQMGYRFMPSSDVVACDTLLDVKNLIRSYAQSVTSIANYLISYGMRSNTPQNALTWGETAGTFFFADYINDSNATYPLVFHFDKSTKKYVNSYIGPTTGGGSSKKQMCASSYSELYDGYLYNTSDGTRDDVTGVNTDVNTVIIYTPALSISKTCSFFETTNLSAQYVYFIVPEVDYTRQFYTHSVSSNILNCYIFDLAASSGYTIYNRELTLTHNAFRVLVGTKSNKVLVISDCIAGEIAYTELNAKEGLYKEALIIKANDFTKTYSLDLGRTPMGGEHSVKPSGSWLLSRDYANRVVLTDTGTTLTDYIGGEIPTESSSLVYVYENYNYIPYPFAREGIKVELSNISKTTKVTIPETQTDLIRTMLASGTDFRGSRCILRRLFPDHTEEGSDIILLDGYIQDWSYSPDKKGILFTVSKTLIDVGATFPKRLMNMGCSHVFKGVRCGYLGADGICTKTKTDCTAKGSVNNFGGFPWVAARQRRVMWR